MKRLLYSFCITLILLACHQLDTSVGPADLLYRRWQAVSSGEYITFRADGIILYGKDGTLGTCCEPRFFIRQATILNFKDALYKPLPAAVTTVDCSDDLVLQTPYGKQTYKGA